MSYTTQQIRSLQPNTPVSTATAEQPLPSQSPDLYFASNALVSEQKPGSQLRSASGLWSAPLSAEPATQGLTKEQVLKGLAAGLAASSPIVTRLPDGAFEFNVVNDFGDRAVKYACRLELTQKGGWQLQVKTEGKNDLFTDVPDLMKILPAVATATIMRYKPVTLKTWSNLLAGTHKEPLWTASDSVCRQASLMKALNTRTYSVAFLQEPPTALPPGETALYAEITYQEANRNQRVVINISKPDSLQIIEGQTQYEILTPCPDFCDRILPVLMAMLNEEIPRNH